MQPLGKNINGYFGETIDLHGVLDRCAAAARKHRWTIEHLDARPKPSLLALTRLPFPSPTRPVRIYLSACIHGDEPAGPLALAALLEQNAWPENVHLFACPCLNPTGLAANRRENSEGTDLNRQYLQPKAEETLAHIGWLEKQPRFDLCLCLHEDWESRGFYLYELNPDHQPSLAEAILRRVSKVCPIDLSEVIEGRPAEKGLIRPSVDPRSRPQWPEAFYLLNHKTRLSYTLEAPSDFPLSTRVGSLVEAVHAAVEAKAGEGEE